MAVILPRVPGFYRQAIPAGQHFRTIFEPEDLILGAEAVARKILVGNNQPVPLQQAPVNIRFIHQPTYIGNVIGSFNSVHHMHYAHQHPNENRRNYGFILVAALVAAIFAAAVGYNYGMYKNIKEDHAELTRHENNIVQWNRAIGAYPHPHGQQLATVQNTLKEILDDKVRERRTDLILTIGALGSAALAGLGMALLAPAATFTGCLAFVGIACISFGRMGYLYTQSDREKQKAQRVVDACQQLLQARQWVILDHRGWHAVPPFPLHLN